MQRMEGGLERGDATVWVGMQESEADVGYFFYTEMLRHRRPDGEEKSDALIYLYMFQ